MGCEICGRGSCTSSFHSSEEVSNFDEVADKAKDRARSIISNAVNRLEGFHQEDEELTEFYYVKLDDVLKIIDEVDI